MFMRMSWVDYNIYNRLLSCLKNSMRSLNEVCQLFGRPPKKSKLKIFQNLNFYALGVQSQTKQDLIASLKTAM